MLDLSKIPDVIHPGDLTPAELAELLQFLPGSRKGKRRRTRKNSTEQPKGNKYGAQSFEALGYRWDSKAEYNRYLLLTDDTVDHVEVHPTVDLCDGITWTLDFCVRYVDGSEHYEDVKSIPTARRQDFKIKRTLFDAHHPAAPLWVVLSIPHRSSVIVNDPPARI